MLLAHDKAKTLHPNSAQLIAAGVQLNQCQSEHTQDQASLQRCEQF